MLTIDSIEIYYFILLFCSMTWEIVISVYSPALYLRPSMIDSQTGHGRALIEGLLC
jgi:hypothetical protein